MEKSQKMQIDTYYLFVDYKATFDSPRSLKAFQAMSEFGMTAMLILIYKITDF